MPAGTGRVGLERSFGDVGSAGELAAVPGAEK